MEKSCSEPRKEQCLEVEESDLVEVTVRDQRPGRDKK